MYNIDFHSLDSKPFERVCAQIFSAKMSKDLERDVQVQSFGEGPDGGVDLLFEWEDNNVTKMYIWQCKRYETFNTLLAGLMKKDKNKPEWEKMHDLMNLHKIRPENFT